MDIDTLSKKTYLKAPTTEQIFSFVDEVGVSYYHFEAYYGMYKGVLKNIKCGYKQLPRKHWWIFYERIVPQYGSFNNFKKPKLAALPRTVSHAVSKKKAKVDDHGRLGRLKNK